MLVVDASVMIQYFLPERHSAIVEHIMDELETPFVPDLLFLETANILWKRVQRQELDPDFARELIERIGMEDLEVVATKPLAGQAFLLAAAYGITVYDASYLAVAKLHGIPCVTADRRFYDAVRKTHDRQSIAWIEDPLPYVM